MLFEAGDKRVICLPGVPREMERMMDSWVVPYLGGLRRGPDSAQVINSKVVRTSGIGESALEALIVDLAHDHDNPTVATYAGGGECQVRITARADSEPQADALIQSVLAPLALAWAVGVWLRRRHAGGSGGRLLAGGVDYRVR